VIFKKSLFFRRTKSLDDGYEEDDEYLDEYDGYVNLMHHDYCFDEFEGYGPEYYGPKGILTSKLPDGTSVATTKEIHRHDHLLPEITDQCNL
jgi:hypothetical protein